MFGLDTTTHLRTVQWRYNTVDFLKYIREIRLLWVQPLIDIPP